MLSSRMFRPLESLPCHPSRQVPSRKTSKFSISFLFFVLRALFTLWSSKNRRNFFPFCRFRALAKITGDGISCSTQNSHFFTHVSPAEAEAQPSAVGSLFFTLFKISPIIATHTENTGGGYLLRASQIGTPFRATIFFRRAPGGNPRRSHES